MDYCTYGLHRHSDIRLVRLSFRENSSPCLSLLHNRVVVKTQDLDLDYYVQYSNVLQIMLLYSTVPAGDLESDLSVRNCTVIWHV